MLYMQAIFTAKYVFNISDKVNVLLKVKGLGVASRCTLAFLGYDAHKSSTFLSLGVSLLSSSS